MALTFVTPDELTPAGGGEDRALHPEGTFPARIVDLIDRGEREHFGSLRGKALFVVMTAEVDAEGRPLLLTRETTNVLSDGGNGYEPSALLTLLREVLARPGLSVRAARENAHMISDWAKKGPPCTVTVRHKEGNAGRVFDSIESFGPPSGTPPDLALYRRPERIARLAAGYRGGAASAETPADDGSNPFEDAGGGEDPAPRGPLADAGDGGPAAVDPPKEASPEPERPKPEPAPEPERPKKTAADIARERQEAGERRGFSKPKPAAKTKPAKTKPPKTKPPKPEPAAKPEPEPTPAAAACKHCGSNAPNRLCPECAPPPPAGRLL